MADVVADQDGLHHVSLGGFGEADENGPGAGVVVFVPGLGGDGIAGFDGLDMGAAAGKEGVGIGQGKGADLAEAIPRGGRRRIEGGLDRGDHEADEDEYEHRHGLGRGGRQ